MRISAPRVRTRIDLACYSICEQLERRALLSGTWQNLAPTNPLSGPLGSQALMLASDGSVLVQGGSNAATPTWFKLAPDSSGNYLNGTWSLIAPMNEGRLFFTTAMLRSGKIFGVGGEYPRYTNTAEVYDPVANSWSFVDPVPTPSTNVGLTGTVVSASDTSPITISTDGTGNLVNGMNVTISGATGNTAANGTHAITNVTGTSFQLVGTTGNGNYTGNGSWQAFTPQYGEDPIEVLPDGSVLAGYFSDGRTFRFIPTNPPGSQWVTAGTKLRGDRSSEETWVKLPDNSILSYDVFASEANGIFQAQRYVPATNTWIDASNLNGANPPSLLSSSAQGNELGPALLQPDGKVIFFGATGNTAIYDPGLDQWSAGPIMPSKPLTIAADGTVTPGGANVQLVATDNPGAMLPNGRILISMSPMGLPGGKLFPNASYIYEYDPVAKLFVAENSPSGINDHNAYTLNMVMLPTGQALLADEFGPIRIFTPNGGPTASWLPVISNITTTGNNDFTMTGLQLNGLSEGSSYGDDNSSSSNYPIVKVTTSTGAVTYARTSNWSSTGVATGNTPVTTQYNLTAGSFIGGRLISVSANGISSGTVLDVTGSVNADTITLNSFGGSTTVNVNGIIQAFTTSSFSGIIINGGNQDDTINLNLINSPPAVTVNGGAGGDRVFINDNSNSAARNYRVIGHQVFSNGPGPNVSYGTDIEQVILSTGTASDTVDVVDTYSHMTLFVDSQGGSDTVNLGTPSFQFTGTAQGIGGAVLLRTIANVNISDDADTIARTAVIDAIDTDAHYNTLSGFAPGLIYLRTGTIGQVNITTGQGGDSLTMHAADTAYFLKNAGLAGDAFSIGFASNGAQGITRDVTIRQGSSTGDFLRVSDQGDTTARSPQFNVGGNTQSISGLHSFSADVIWDIRNIATMEFTTGNAVDNVAVGYNAENLHIITPFGTGGDTINIANHLAGAGLNFITGPITVDDFSILKDTLIVDDTGNATPRFANITVAGNYETITGLAPVPISFGTQGFSVLLATGSNDDSVRVSQNDASTRIQLFSASGTDSVAIGSVGNKMEGVAGTIDVNNDFGKSYLFLLDAGDTTGRTAVFSKNGGRNEQTGLSTAVISWDPNDLLSLAVQCGEGHDNLTINGMWAGADPVVAMYGGPGNDTFTVQNFTELEAARIASKVAVYGEADNDRLFVNNATDTQIGTDNRAYYGVGSNEINQLYLAPAFTLHRSIGHDQVETLQLTAGNSPDQIWVNGIDPEITRMEVNGGGGVDNIEVEQNAPGSETVVTQSTGLDHVLVETNSLPGLLRIESALTLNSLTVTAGATANVIPIPGQGLQQYGTLSITNGGRFNLFDNDLLVHGTAKSTIENYIRTAYNFGGWDGAGGIFSSSSLNASPATTMLGLLSGDEYLANSGNNQFDGSPVSGSDVLVKYTYYGDVDFNGQVDGTDYNIIDFGFLTAASGWANGDVDYNFQVDGSDYNAIDFAYLTQVGIL